MTVRDQSSIEGQHSPKCLDVVPDLAKFLLLVCHHAISGWALKTLSRNLKASSCSLITPMVQSSLSRSKANLVCIPKCKSNPG